MTALVKPKEKSITDHLGELEGAVKDAESKKSVLESAETARTEASNSYSTAVSKVQKLQTEIQDRIGNIFPNARIKVSA
jgi:hypothetical protein